MEDHGLKDPIVRGQARRGPRRIDPVAVGGAPAMREEGFTDEEIVSVFGYLPPIDMDRDTLSRLMDDDLADEKRELERAEENGKR